MKPFEPNEKRATITSFAELPEHAELDRLSSGVLRRIIAIQNEIALSGLDLQTLMEKIAHYAHLLLECDGAVIELLDGDEMVYRACGGTMAAYVGLRLRAAASLSGLCVREGKILQSTDTETDSRVDRDACRKVRVRSMIVMPLRFESRTVGVLKVMSQVAGFFRPEAEHILALLANTLSSAMSNSEEFDLNLAERRRAEKELIDTASILNAIMAATSDLIYVKDRQSRMIYCNLFTLKLLGQTESELYGKNDVEFLGAGRGGEEILRTDERIMSSGIEEISEERVTWPDGTLRIYQSQKTPRRGSDGRVVGLIGISRDMTDIKRTQEALERSVRSRDEFLSIASHELKTPLTSLKLQAELVQRETSKQGVNAILPARVAKLVDQTNKQVSRLSRLVEGMLDISRINSGKLTFSKTEFALGELARDVVDLLMPQLIAASRGVAPVLIIAQDSRGSWDRDRIEQVLTNLLTNAMRYGGGFPVEVVVDRRQDHALLSVKDRGAGIAEKDRERIFDRFERAIDANEVSGLGLGLFIARTIVDAHGGTIQVESELGAGSTFTVALPVTGHPR